MFMSQAHIMSQSVRTFALIRHSPRFLERLRATIGGQGRYIFSTPAGVKDYKDNENYTQWSKFISESMTDVVTFEEETVGKGKDQFYNPEIKPARLDKKNAVVSWNGFPRRLETESPNNYLEVADKKDGWPFNKMSKARNQDEYLEWYVYKNADGKIMRVDFTSEGPEYWETLFEWEPNTCLGLYQQFISPNVKLEDLSTVDDKGKKVYNSYNKWNTTHGCMHLNCPPNSLTAEIRLAGDASILRKINGNILTDSQQLINCSQYGLASRNSDPQIGSACNTLCRAGYRITIGDPVCLYIKKVRTSGWTTPDGRNASQYMKLVRGTKDEGLRYSLQVPDSENFTVGDIMIGGEPIQYGGTVASLMDIGLTAEYCTNEKGVQAAYECVGETGDSENKMSHPKKHPLLKGKAQCVHRAQNSH